MEHCEVDHCTGPADVLLPTITFPVQLCWKHAEWVLPSRNGILRKAATAALSPGAVVVAG